MSGDMVALAVSPWPARGTGQGHEDQQPGEAEQVRGVK
jgi:hypothetical protein